jgi:E3 ubiquitin-protein ligase HUWE1
MGTHGPTPFQIHRAANSSALPTAHTCFNQLDLPEYSSVDTLKQRLLLALREGSTGFGFQ